MKKFLLATAVLGASFGANAQDSYKFEAGDKNLEVQFSPLGGTPVSISGIRFRLFNSESSAIRATVFLGYSNEKTATDLGGKEGKDQMYNREGSLTFNFRPGYEWHFAGTERLSPYVGAELDLALKTHTLKEEYTDGEGEIKEDKTTGTEGYFRAGLNAVAGADYYFARKAYLGIEMGYGFSYLKQSDIKVTLAEGENPDDQKQGSTFDLAPNFNAMLRLGYCF